MDEDREPWRRVCFFCLLTVALSAIFWYFIIRTGRLGAGRGLYVTGLMWSPGAAGLATRYRYEKSLKHHGWTWGPPRLQLLSYRIPIADAAPVYLVAWMTGLGGFYHESFLASQKTAFGWSAAGFTNVALISGVGWAVWHYPLLLFADYNAGTRRGS